MGWENGSAPLGEGEKFARFGKVCYFLKTENGSVELSKRQYIERAGVYAENIDRRAERETSEAFDYDEITQNDYNLSVSTYVEAEDTREKIDIVKLNAEIREIVAREQVLRDEIDKIIAEIEGGQTSEQ